MKGLTSVFVKKLANDELSIGDYVLTNGALPAMVVIDSAVTRLLPGVLGDDESSRDECVQRWIFGISAIIRGRRIFEV